MLRVAVPLHIAGYSLKAQSFMSRSKTVFPVIIKIEWSITESLSLILDFSNQRRINPFRFWDIQTPDLVQTSLVQTDSVQTGSVGNRLNITLDLPLVRPSKENYY